MSFKRNKTVKSYDQEFKKNATKLVIVEKMSVPEVAKDLGMSETTLYAWISVFKKGETLADKRSKGVVSTSAEKKSVLALQLLEAQKKTRELEQKIKRITMERDILKKATAYFAQNPS